MLEIIITVQTISIILLLLVLRSERKTNDDLARRYWLVFDKYDKLQTEKQDRDNVFPKGVVGTTVQVPAIFLPKQWDD